MKSKILVQNNKIWEEFQKRKANPKISEFMFKCGLYGTEEEIYFCLEASCTLNGNLKLAVRGKEAGVVAEKIVTEETAEKTAEDMIEQIKTLMTYKTENKDWYCNNYDCEMYGYIENPKYDKTRHVYICSCCGEDLDEELIEDEEVDTERLCEIINELIELIKDFDPSGNYSDNWIQNYTDMTAEELDFIENGGVM